MNINKVIDNIVEDIGTELLDEYDRNFERKGFFNQSWKPTKHHNSRGSLLTRTGTLRRSINRQKSKRSLRFTSSVPYAKLMNEGGTIIVTAKMKKFFWAMYQQNVTKAKKGSKKQAEKLSAEALKWKRMALMKIGTKMKVEQRQFLGWHPQVDAIIKSNADFHIKELNKQILKKLKQ
jgi:phage gpG-like protein